MIDVLLFRMQSKVLESCQLIAFIEAESTQVLAILEQTLLQKQAELEIKLPIIEDLEKRQEFLEAIQAFENEASNPLRF